MPLRYSECGSYRLLGDEKVDDLLLYPHLEGSHGTAHQTAIDANQRVGYLVESYLARAVGMNAAQGQDRGGAEERKRHPLPLCRPRHQPADGSRPAHHHLRMDGRRRDEAYMAGAQHLHTPRQASGDTTPVATKITTRLK